MFYYKEKLEYQGASLDVFFTWELVFSNEEDEIIVEEILAEVSFHFEYKDIYDNELDHSIAL